MNSIHERHVPSQEKPRSMNHTFLKITRWRNNRKNKINYRSYCHISLKKSFQWANNFVILIPYEKVMPILVNLFNPQRCPKIYPPQSFALFPKSCEIPKRYLILEQIKCLIFYLYRSWRIYSHVWSTCINWILLEGRPTWKGAN